MYQLTDIHWDWEYEEGNSPLLNCRAGWGSIGKYGYVYCSSPYALVRDTVHFIKQTHNPEIVVWSGDTIRWAQDPLVSHNVALEHLSNITMLMNSTFTDSIILPLLGNHDVIPGHQMGTGPGFWLYDSTWEYWKNLLPADMEDEYKKGGYYTKLIKTKSGATIRAVVPNTNLWYTGNELNIGKDDPADQFAWLESVLSSAKANDEAVVMIAHIPPGDGFKDSYNKRYISILQTYASIIITGIYGHNHEDSFRLIYSNSQPVNVAWTSPGLVPSVKPRNPAYRRFDIDTSTRVLTDAATYVAEIDAINAAGVLSYQLEYTFVQEYKLADASASSLGSLWERLTRETALLQRFCELYGISYHGDGWDGNWDNCMESQLCDIRYADHSENDACKDAQKS